MQTKINRFIPSTPDSYHAYTILAETAARKNCEDDGCKQLPESVESVDSTDMMGGCALEKARTKH
ncbi:MAG: hypothetical protein Kow00121_52150 [Elainellaceae cyanobacterium]